MFHIFISYAHEDGREYRDTIIGLLKKNGFKDDDYWYDERDINPGEEWRTEIDKALNESFIVIIILTKKAIKSHYVTYEWTRAIGDGITIIPILFEDLSNKLPRSKLWGMLNILYSIIRLEAANRKVFDTTKIEHPLLERKQYVDWRKNGIPEKVIATIKQHRKTTPDYKYLNNEIAKAIKHVRVLSRLALWLYSYSSDDWVDGGLAKQQMQELVKRVDQTSERLLELLINHSQVFISKQKRICQNLVDNLYEFSLMFKHTTPVNDRFIVKYSFDNFREIELFRHDKIEPLLNYFVVANGNDNLFYVALNKCLNDISAKQRPNGLEFMECESAIINLFEDDINEARNIMLAIKQVRDKILG